MADWARSSGKQNTSLADLTIKLAFALSPLELAGVMHKSIWKRRHLFREPGEPPLGGREERLLFVGAD